MAFKIKSPLTAVGKDPNLSDEEKNEILEKMAKMREEIIEEGINQRQSVEGTKVE